MIQALWSILSVFPVSFLVYATSKRWIARHEARVGKKIDFFAFIAQEWVDTAIELRRRRPWTEWAILVSQLLFAVIPVIDLDYLLFAFIALNSFLLAQLSPVDDGAVGRIESDRKQVAFLIAQVMVLFCSVGAFTLSGTANLMAHVSTLGMLPLLLPFQLAGMILFGEHPFGVGSGGKGWIESARFYAWSLLTAHVFLGGGAYFFDLNLKAAALYLLSRQAAIYFPAYRQKDLIRISVLYLFPITGIIWFLVMLFHAWGGTGGGGGV